MSEDHTGGLWNIPTEITDETGNRCSADDVDAPEIQYLQNIYAMLEGNKEVYDTSRLFTSGCSMGSAMSIYSATCTSKMEEYGISAFATHSTGLKTKDDGIKGWPQISEFNSEKD